MKTADLIALPSGSKLLLKPDRAAAYGLDDRIIIIDHIQADRHGRAVPWVVATHPDGVSHYYRPSDFSRLA